MSAHKYRPEIQLLFDIEVAGENNWLRIYCRNGLVFEGYPECSTYVTVDEDEDVDALSFVLRKGMGRDIGGIEIDHFEILEPR